MRAVPYANRGAGGAEVGARAAADSERLALLSYHKNRLFFFCHRLEFAGNLFLSFSFLIPTVKCIQMDLG